MRFLQLDMAVLEFKAPDKIDPHMSGEAICAACGHESIAVVPVGTWLFECPACHAHKGHMKHPCLPADGHIWNCGCGCDVFRITTKEAICINYGQKQQF